MMALRLEDLLAAYQERRAALDREGVYFLGDITDPEAEQFSKAILLMSIERRSEPSPQAACARTATV